MPDLTSRSIRDAGPHEPRIQRGDERTIVMKDGTRIAGRKAGGTYVVDSSLAHHYVEVAKVAAYADAKKDDPPAVNDRAMHKPPRGK